MRISRFAVENYKGIEKVELWMPKTIEDRPNSGNLLSIIGKNNVGKSSVLTALQKALELSRLTREEFPHRESFQEPVSVEIEFDGITAADKEKPAIRNNCVSENRYIIRIEWHKPGVDPLRKVKDTQAECIYPDNPKRKESWTNHADWGPLVNTYESRHGSFSYKTENVARLEQIAFDAKATNVYKLEEWQDDKNYRSNPGGWQSLLLNALPRIVYVPAIRETKDEAEVSKKGATIRELATHLFEKQLDTHQTIQALKRAAAQVGRLFTPKEKDSIVAEMESKINNILMPLANVTGQLNFQTGEIGIDLLGYADFSLQDKHGPPTKPNHQGHGTQRALVLSLLQALAEIESPKKADRGLVLLFEEPEIYLHPEMCRKMRDTLIAISRKPDTQVICTTHSPILLDLAERHDGIALLRKDKLTGKVTYFQRAEDIFDDEKDKEARPRLRMVLDFDPTVNEFFFTERVCLVEGDTEIAAISAVAKKLVEDKKIDHGLYQKFRHDVTVINCRSKATMPAFQKVLNEFGIKYRVVHDSDSDTSSKGTQTLNNTIKTLLAEAHPVDWRQNLLIHEPEFEQQLLGEKYNYDKPWRTYNNIKERATLDDATDLVNYFTFVLHCSLADLVPQPNLLDSADVSPKPRRSFDAPRRDTRNKFRYREIHLRRSRPLEPSAALGIAAGPGRIYEVDEFLACDQLTSEYVVAKVVGDSMLDTLRTDDRILLRKLDNIFLDATEDGASMITMDKFKEYILNDHIYVLAINDDIERKAYTIKRVRYSGSGIEWICRIVADNPEVQWHSRGEFVVRRTDRIHFAAEVIDLVMEAERPPQTLGPELEQLSQVEAL